MRKKYLSALLFGALLFASAGTFTSCKDYDDDINNLQSQITANADAIKALQDIVNAGNYVTDVTGDGSTITFTFSDGTTKAVTVESGETSQTLTIDPETGELLNNGEPTGIKPATDAELSSIIMGEDGCWQTLQEDGTYKTTGIPVSGVSVVGSEADGYTLTIVDANGDSQDVKIPSAASSITQIELRALNSDASEDALTIYNYDSFEFTPSANIKNASDWKGSKAIPADGSVVYSTNKLGLQINPTNVDATLVNKFLLTNSKNETLSSVVLKATEYTDYLTRGTNGLYTLSMENTVLTDKEAETLSDELTKYKGVLFAVNVNSNVRSAYNVLLNTEAGTHVESIKLKGVDNSNIDVNSTGNWTNVKVGQTYTIEAVKSADLYDLYCEVSDKVQEAYDIVIDKANHTFTVNKNPDTSTTEVSFPMTVYAIDNYGIVTETTVTVALSSEIPSASEYAEITKNVSEKDKTFKFDLATMMNGLGNLQSWKLNVDLDATSYKLYGKYSNNTLSEEVTFTDDAAVVGTGTGMLLTPKFVDASGNTTNDVDKAVNVVVTVDNSKAAAAGVQLDKTYYLEVTYTDGTNKLNSSIIPVKFTAPVLSDLFAVRAGYVSNGVINAYFYAEMDETVTPIANASKVVDLAKYFSAIPEDVTFNLDSKTTVVTDNNKEYKTSDVLNAISLSGTSYPVELVSTKKVNSQFELGYGADLIINATKDNYEGWAYAEEADGQYTFKISLKSPIVEGTIKPVGTTVEISANDMTNGAKITDDMIKGYDYNSNVYSIVPDEPLKSATGTPDATWYQNPQIQSVVLNPDEDGYISSTSVTSATKDSNGATVLGYFTVKGNALSTEQTVNVPVTVKDAWGYTLTVNVPVTIKINK